VLEFPKSDPANPEIERMWAWRKVDRLLKEADRTGSRTPVIGEIVRLGEIYSIATEYTSFIVLENDAEYQRWKIDRRNLLRVARDRKQQQIVQTQLQALRERALADLGPKPADPRSSSSDQQLPSQGPLNTTAGQRAPLPTHSPPGPRNRNLRFAPSSPGGGGGGGGSVEWLFLASLGALGGGKLVSFLKSRRGGSKSQE
jgi:hypothetical protein